MTKGGKDPLLSEEENIANLVEPPTEEEKNMAITGNLSNILVLVIPDIILRVIQLNLVDESRKEIQASRC